MLEVLSEWQTLATGISALFVGGVTVYLLRRQIGQQDEHYRQIRRSKYSVAKAKLPVAAVAIIDYVKPYLTAAEELWPLVQSRSTDQFRFIGPDFPEKAEVILDGVVEHTENEILIDQISALYSEHQVMSSRLSGVRNPSQHSLTITSYVLQPIMIDAIALNLLAFGRDGSELRKISWHDIRESAKRLIVDAGIRTVILQEIDDKIEREKPVPLALRKFAND